MSDVVPAATGPSLELFRKAAEQFLGEHAQPRRPSAQSGPQRQYSLFRASSVAEADAAREWQRKVVDGGFGWIRGPREYGGRDLPSAYERSYQALERSYITPPRAALGVSLGMVAPTLMEVGSDEAKQRWARALHRGDAIGCQLFSEPGAGSDLAAVSTTAVEHDGGWIVNGQKVWTSGAHYSDVGLLLARTSTEAPWHRNLTAFLIDMRGDGVEVRPLRQMTDRRTSTRSSSPTSGSPMPIASATSTAAGESR